MNYFINNMSAKLSVTASLFLKLSEKTLNNIRSTMDKIRYDMPSVQFYLSDPSSYLHNLDNSVWSARNENSESVKNKSPAHAQNYNAELLGQVISMFNNQHPCHVGQLRGRGRVLVNRSTNYQSSNTDLICFNSSKPCLR